MTSTKNVIKSYEIGFTARQIAKQIKTKRMEKAQIYLRAQTIFRFYINRIYNKVNINVLTFFLYILAHTD